MLRHSRQIRRGLAVAALVLAAATVAVALLREGDAYVVTARFTNASQLVAGNEVQVAGAKIGSVRAIALADDGDALVRLAIEDPEYVPLRRGTEAIVRLTSLSGVANRY